MEMEMEMQALEVVMVSFPFQSHFNPLLELARRILRTASSSRNFTRRRVSVTLFHFDTIKAPVTTPPKPHMLGQLQAIVAEEAGIKFVGVPDGLPQDHPRTPSMPEYLQATQRAMAEPLRRYIRHQQAEYRQSIFIIADTFMPWTRESAQALHLPRAVLWTSSATTFSIFRHAHLLIENGVIPDPDHGDEGSPFKSTATESAIIDYIPGVPTLAYGDIPSIIRARGFGAGFLKDQLGQLEDAWRILVHSGYELEKAVFDAPAAGLRRLLAVGPLMELEAPVPVTDADKGLMEWLGSKDTGSVVYVALGSVYRAQKEEIQEIAAALEAMEGQPFVWALSCSDEPSRAFIASFARRTRDRGLLLAWAPQRLVLSHPSVGAFFSHSGWNSTLESIRARVPMVSWPRDSEQATNAKLIADEWCVGVRLAPDADHHAIRLAIRRLLHENEGSRLRANMHALSAACFSTSSSQANLEGFLHEVLGNA